MSGSTKTLRANCPAVKCHLEAQRILQPSSALPGQCQSLGLSRFSFPQAAVPMANKNALAGYHLGAPCSALESVTSMDPKDYVWGTPSPQQQQILFQQFMQMAFFAFVSHQNSVCRVLPTAPTLQFPAVGPGFCGPPSSYPMPPGFPTGQGNAPGPYMGLSAPFGQFNPFTFPSLPTKSEGTNGASNPQTAAAPVSEPSMPPAKTCQIRAVKQGPTTTPKPATCSLGLSAEDIQTLLADPLEKKSLKCAGSNSGASGPMAVTGMVPAGKVPVAQKRMSADSPTGSDGSACTNGNFDSTGPDGVVLQDSEVAVVGDLDTFMAEIGPLPGCKLDEDMDFGSLIDFPTHGDGFLPVSLENAFSTSQGSEELEEAFSAATKTTRKNKPAKGRGIQLGARGGITKKTRAGGKPAPEKEVRKCDDDDDDILDNFLSAHPDFDQPDWDALLNPL